MISDWFVDSRHYTASLGKGWTWLNASGWCTCNLRYWYSCLASDKIWLTRQHIPHSSADWGACSHYSSVTAWRNQSIHARQIVPFEFTSPQIRTSGSETRQLHFSLHQAICMHPTPNACRPRRHWKTCVRMKEVASNSLIKMHGNISLLSFLYRKPKPENV